MKPENVKVYFDDMIKDLATLVSYPSVYSNDEGTPFGINNRDCLAAALKIAENYGFKAVNVDDYCGYIEMGQGEQIIGILAHLDVVPVSDTWATDPFKLTQIGDCYYGRGTTDDKGAAIATLTAMRMLKELEPTFTKRVRLILGCNEETGSRGVEYYVKKYGYVDCGFTPDGNFPLVYGEKGMARGLLELNSDKIIDIKGGTVSNAVANFVKVTLKNASDLDVNKLDEFFKANNISYTLEGNELSVSGVASHASLPDLGVNAISYAMEGLYVAGLNDEATSVYHKLVGTSIHGENMNIAFKDEYGDLSFNIGLAFKKDEMLCFTIDIRYPVTLTTDYVVGEFTKNSEGYISNIAGGDPLFFPPDHPMISALMDAYVSVTGDNETKPWVIGGGTYAKSMKGIVAFGCEDEECNYHIHDDNEFVTGKSLLKQAACYYQAIVNLMKI